MPKLDRADKYFMSGVGNRMHAREFSNDKRHSPPNMFAMIGRKEEESRYPRVRLHV